MYPKKGAGIFLEKIYNKLDKSKVKLNKEIIKINQNEKIAYTKDGEEIKYEYLINTAPLKSMLNSLDEIELANDLSYNQVLVFNLGFKKGSNFKEHWIYFPNEYINFYRVGFYNNILNQDKLSLYIEIGFGKDDSINVEEQLKLTLENLEKVGIIENNELEAYESIIMNPAYVHIQEDVSNKIKKCFEKLSMNNIYSIGRYGAFTYCSMEDGMIMANELAYKLN
jgi:protoporphyrinogen oxidase